MERQNFAGVSADFRTSYYYVIWAPKNRRFNWPAHLAAKLDSVEHLVKRDVCWVFFVQRAKESPNFLPFRAGIVAQRSRK